MFIINFFCLNMFRASLCTSSGEQRPCYCIWCVVLVLLDVVGSGCGALRCRMRAVRLHFQWLASNYPVDVSSPLYNTVIDSRTWHPPVFGRTMDSKGKSVYSSNQSSCGFTSIPWQPNHKIFGGHACSPYCTGQFKKNWTVSKKKSDEHCYPLVAEIRTTFRGRNLGEKGKKLTFRRLMSTIVDVPHR